MQKFKSNMRKIDIDNHMWRQCYMYCSKGYIKWDRTKHILQKFFFTHDLQNSGDINVQQVHSHENLEVFLWSHYQGRLLNNWLTRLYLVVLKVIVCIRGRVNTLCTLFPLAMVFSHQIFLPMFLMKHVITYWRMMYSFLLD